MIPGMRHEVASQRRHFRVTAPILIHIGKETCQAVNWSIIDFKIAGYGGSLKAGEETNVHVTIPYQGFDIGFATKARIVRIDPAGQTLIAEFIHMNEREREILENFVSGLLRGEMESIGGILRRMDVPVTPASLKTDHPMTPAEAAAQERKRHIGTLLYIAAGFVFSLALITVLYTNLFQVKVRTAQLSAPTDIIIAPATGSVKHFLIDERADTKKDTALIRFSDPELEQNIERAALRLEELMAGGKELALAPGSNNDSAEIRAARAAVGSWQANLEVKSAAMNRQRKLLAEGLTNKLAFDKAQSDYFDTQSELNAALQRLGQLTRQSNSKLSLLSVTEGEYRMLMQRREGLTVHAPANGRILKTLVRPGSSIRYGDPVAIFQHDAPRYIEAYLTRDEALSVTTGDIAAVHFPSHGITEHYKVEDVDYASQLITRREGHYALEQAGQMRDVLVRLALDDPNPDEKLKQISPGASAEVIFTKPIFGR